MKYRFFILLFVSLSCNPQPDTESCDELSMKKYKGIPNSYQHFEKNCKGTQIKYTAELCQSALLKLIRTNNLNAVKIEFGDPVEHCFTGDDLRRFNKK